MRKVAFFGLTAALDGDQTWEEMIIGWFDVAFDAKLDPNRKTPQSGLE